MERLASVGIGKTMAARIARQFKQFGADQGGLRIANTEQSTDTEAVMAFRAAVARETDKIVVTPGVGDRPPAVSSLLNRPELAQLVFQFRCFAFAASQREICSASGLVRVCTHGSLRVVPLYYKKKPF